MGLLDDGGDCIGIFDLMFEWVGIVMPALALYDDVASCRADAFIEHGQIRAMVHVVAHDHEGEHQGDGTTADAREDPVTKQVAHSES